MKKYSFFVLCFLLALTGKTNAQTAKTEAAVSRFKNKLDSASYAMGVSIAQDLKSRSIKELNYTVMVQAMQEVLSGASPALDMRQCQEAIMSYFSQEKKKANEPLKAAALRFMEENKKRKGVFLTPSGLQYEILRATTAPKPKETEQVTVHYKGTLIDGKPFDSSYDRNEPAKFQLNQVIKGWTEGVQLMTVGSKYRFYIPHELAYGENGAGTDIPPFSVLIFEIELLKIGQ